MKNVNAVEIGYTDENMFYTPTDIRWSVIAAKAHKPEIDAAIDNAMCAIKKENKRLKDILPRSFACPELENFVWTMWSICSRT